MRGSGHSMTYHKVMQKIFLQMYSAVSIVFSGAHDMQKLVAQCYDGKECSA